MAGIVHFSRYFLWMEQAEHEFLDTLGLGVIVEHNGNRYGLPRVSATCDYLAPARYRDILSIGVSVAEIGRSSIRYAFDFVVAGKAVARGSITVCFCAITPSGIASHPLPDWFREKLGNGA
jgi:YbgC/YbaW family acyl-CoA thioester hydrolase